MKQALFIHTAKALVFSAFILLAACSSNPEKEDRSRGANSQDMIFDRAKSAYLSKNYKSAAALLSNLADKGHTEAQYTLGYMYYHGIGVQKNYKQAVHLFNLSAARGNDNAVTALSNIQKTATDNKLQTTTESKPQPQDTTPVVDLRKLPATPAGTQPTPDLPKTIPQKQPALLPTTPEVSQHMPVTSQKPEIVNQTEVEQYVVSDHKRQPSSDNNTDQVIRSTKEVKSAEWISSQPPGYFTIQLSSSTSYRKTLDFMRKVELDGVYFFRTTANNIDRFTVIHGSFTNYAIAKSKIDVLKERGYKNVWIRGFRGIQASISKQ